MDIQHNTNINLVSVIDDIKTYELTTDFIHQYKKLCIYYCTFSIQNNQPKIINTSLRMLAPEEWALCNTSIIDNNNELKHSFYFYKQKSKGRNKEFYQSIIL